MKRIVAALLLIGFHGAVFAQTPAPSPEECLVKRGETAAASATFNAKTYEFRKAECREVFLSDPERYAQLYDALAELAEAGAPIVPSQEASLVPS